MKHRLALFAIAAAGSVLATDSHKGGSDPNTPESLLVRTLDAIRAERLDDAQRSADSLVRRQPDFRLAQLIRSDILAARSGSRPTVNSKSAAGLRDEARVRMARSVQKVPEDSLPEWLLEPPANANTALVVDTRASRLYVFARERNTWRLMSDFYTSIGQQGAAKRVEGDMRTPIGAYTLQTRIDDSKLDDFYGIGAWPMNYPNDLDRRKGRNGHGIWLHGTPRDTYSRPPKASSGCVVLPNSDLGKLEPTFQAGVTPILIVDSMRWTSRRNIQATRESLIDALTSWRQDWSSGSVDRYLAHYSENFTSDRGDIQTWERDKRRIAASKNWIQVDLSDVSFVLVPGEKDLAVVDFTQDYRSSNLTNLARKRQYWQKEDGAWRIVWEGSAS